MSKLLVNEYNNENIVKKFEALIPKLMKGQEVVGLSYSLIKNAKVIGMNAFGLSNADTKENLKINSISDTGSLSKPVFAYGVLLLCAKGKLNLDKPLSKYLNEPYISDERINLITARMCLSHSTGFPNWRECRFSKNPKPLKIFLHPGERYSYSGEGFVYLQNVIENITGQSIDKYLNENVLIPLGMTESSFTFHGIKKSEIAAGHNQEKKPLVYHFEKPNAAFSLRSTPRDYAKFLVAMLTTDNDKNLLSVEWITNMLTTQIHVTDDFPSYNINWPKDKVNKLNDVSWGLGWGLQTNSDGETFFWHWGDNEVYKAFTLLSIERKSGIVLMSNSNTGSKIWIDILHTLFGDDLPVIPYLNISHPGYL